MSEANRIACPKKANDAVPIGHRITLPWWLGTMNTHRKRVVYQGVEMDAEWPPYIEGAQQDLTYEIGGKVYPRIRYGDESFDWGADRWPCHDCAVLKGQLHVRGCDAEECPVCGGQAIGCDCPYDRDAGWGD